jgi:hypothetical protein
MPGCRQASQTRKGRAWVRFLHEVRFYMPGQQFDRDEISIDMGVPTTCSMSAAD